MVESNSEFNAKLQPYRHTDPNTVNRDLSINGCASVQIHFVSPDPPPGIHRHRFLCSVSLLEWVKTRKFHGRADENSI
jgi:hypothetical protein